MNRYNRTFVRSTNIKSKLKNIKNTLILNKIRFRIIYFQICSGILLNPSRAIVCKLKNVISNIGYYFTNSDHYLVSWI